VTAKSNPDPSGLRPALFDLQVNGFAGVDFQSAEIDAPALHRALAGLHAHRVHRLLVTLITDRPERLLRQLDRFEALRARDTLAQEMIVGYHLEGPWLNPAPGFHGAHPPELMRKPDPAELARLHAAASGRLRLLTVAPELPGGIELIAAARRLGLVVSLGHTDASESDIDQAIAAGATLCTHLGNGVPANLPRHDNIIQRLLARDELTACFIPDGHHLPPFVLKNLFRAKPAGRVILTTDAMAGAGAGPGRYTLGRLEVEMRADGIVREPGQPNFAGSSLTLDRGIDNAARWLGISRPAAWSLGSTVPAAVFGLELPLIPNRP